MKTLSNTNKNLYNEINEHLMSDEVPSNYLKNVLSREVGGIFPFGMLFKMRQTKQSPEHHPEGSVFNHTIMVVDEAAKVKHRSKNPRAFMWAALLHDIGKPDTTRLRKGKITSYDHDKVGAKLARQFLEEFEEDNEFVDAVVALVRWHMQIMFVAKDMRFARVEEMKAEVDVEEVALLGFCDRLGRLNVNRKKEEENIKLFLDKTSRTQ